MSDKSRPPGQTQPSEIRSNPEPTIDLPAAESAGPAETTDLKSPPAHETDAGEETPRRPPAETATYHPAFDPGRTSQHTPAEAPEPDDAPRARPSVPGYEIESELGRGGMGVVYKARQIGLGRVVALKMILAGPHASPSVIARFIAEARAVARFQHSNLVQVFEVGEYDGTPFFSLEFVEGGTLAKKIAREPQPPQYAAETVEQLARAMQYAHDRGIAHRDLKPANVLLAPDGTPKVTDFGLAKSLEGDSGQTQSGQIMGTPSYMAPEQAEGRPDVGAPADVYALGAILYDLLTGRPPFAGSSVLDTLEMVRTREPVPPSELTGKLPRDLETICLKCLQKDAAKRYASAGELADDLRRFLDGRPILARPVGRAERAWRWAKRNPAGALAVGLGLALLIVPSILSGFLFVAEARATESAKEEGKAKTLAQQKQKEAEDAGVEKDKAIVAKDAALVERTKALAEKDAALKEEKIARANEARALQVKAEQRNNAIFTVRDVLLEVDRQMKFRGEFAPARLLIINKMLTRLDVIRAPEGTTELDDRTEAIAYSLIGLIYYDANRVDRAAEWTGRAHELLTRLAVQNPKDPAALFNLANISNQLADTEWRRGNGDRARELYAAALKLRQDRVPLVEALVKGQKDGKGKFGPADVVNAKYQVADSHGLVALAHLRLGDPDAAAENYLASDKWFRELFPGGQVPKEQWRVRQKRAEIQLRLGDARLHQRRPDEAEKHYRAALKERESILADAPEHERPTLRTDVALSRMYLGDFLLMTHKDNAAAVAEYEEALKLYGDALKLVPDHLGLQQRVAAVHYRLGYAARKRSGFAAAGGPFAASYHFGECLRTREALAKIDPTDVPAKAELMLALGRVGRAAEAEELAKELLGLKPIDQQTRFQAVCGLAVASGHTDDARAAGRCRDLAFAALADLVKEWKARGQLELDPDLESLRADPRFARLVAAGAQ